MSLVVESGATVKETQELARHSTPQLTMNVYARARQDRLSEAVERVGEVVLSTSKRVPSVYRLVLEQNKKPQSLLTQEVAALLKWWRRRPPHFIHNSLLH